MTVPHREWRSATAVGHNREVNTLIVPEHMGGLHVYEQALVMLLAFGPLLVLGIVIRFVRRRDRAEEELAGGTRDVIAPR